MESRKVWKYVLEPIRPNIVEMPEGAEMISVAVQNGAPVLWALVEPSNRLVKREIDVCPTGASPLDGFRYFIGTVTIEGHGFGPGKGLLVFHIFEIGDD